MLYGKTGVLVVNLGTPDAPTRGAVWRYLQQFLTDRRVIDYPWLPRNLLVRGIIAPLRSGSSAKLYQEVWTENGSPLKYYGEVLVDELKPLLGDDYVVELAMRYQNPSIGSALQKLMKEQVSEIIVLPLFAQYASATTGSMHDEIMRLMRQEENIPNIRMINSYYDYEPMIDVYAENGQTFDLDSYDHILFSFHGLPQRQLRKADPSGCHCTKKDNCCGNISKVNQFCYSAQCHATARAIAAKCGIADENYTVTFQSRLGPEAWAQPYTIKVIEEWAKEKNAKRLLVFSPAFVSDCLETTVEIGTEYQEEFEEWGGETIDLVPSLNDNPKWIKAVADLIRMNDVRALANVNH